MRRLVDDHIELALALMGLYSLISKTLHWRHNGRDSVSNHQPHDCLLNRLFRRRSKKTSKLRVTGLCVGNSPGTGEFPAHMASNAENVSIWWHRHDILPQDCELRCWLDSIADRFGSSAAEAPVKFMSDYRTQKPHLAVPSCLEIW